ncbi:MAG TPA: hypothetical protein VLH09_11430 [Bryobacteraceae bacterium]|nr:hypothetical protein [Bryobacteraceae bacterium]
MGLHRYCVLLAVVAFVAVLFQGAMGGLAAFYGLPNSLDILLACAAQLFFALAAASTAFTSPAWRGQTLALEDTGFPPLRVLAAAVPVAVLAQAALGAAYRHGALGLMPHVAGALLVTGLILVVSMIILTQFGQQPVLAKPAKRLLVIALHQVVLGVLAYVLRIITDGAGRSGWLVAFAAVAHVAVGALTMGTGVILAVQVWRHVHPPEPEITR